MAIWHNMCILDEIARCIMCPEDFVAFSRVSRFCRAAAVKENIRFTYHPIPWLMLPPKKGTTDLHRFYSILDGTCVQINLPDAIDNRFYSSKGWFLVIDEACNLFLLNPFSGIRIDLPHPTTFQSYNHEVDLCTLEPDFMQILMILKFALSVSPSSSDNYTVMVLYQGEPKLAYYRPGFTSWIDINCDGCNYKDFIYFHDKFYAIDSYGQIDAIDIKADNTVELQQVVPSGLLTTLIGFSEQLYLVETDGKLLVIHRSGVERDDDGKYGTTGFQVFQVDLENNSLFQINDLGSRVIFVGDNSSFTVDFSLSSVEFFVLKGIPPLKSNCIYFSDDCQLIYLDHAMVDEHGGKDIGVYDMRDGSVKPFDMPDYQTFGAISLPVWIEHTF